jgi:CubicO group peptidase (beta-lactamase class C family)
MVDLAGWRPRLDELTRRHQVPGASLAVLAGGEVATLATGVLHKGTGVEVTTDSLFQIGSMTKAYTATVVLALVDQGLAGVDTPVAELLPGFRVADPEVSRRVTLRHLLCHTSGINGDFFLDTGRGDDCLARYVEACAGLEQSHPLGATFSYCNTGYVILGRVIEQLTGAVWDAAVAEHLAAPLGLTHTWTLPEDVLRFRAAMGHVTGSPGQEPQPASSWYEMRSLRPAGLVCATAADAAAFARLHLDHGRAPRRHKGPDGGHRRRDATPAGGGAQPLSDGRPLGPGLGPLGLGRTPGRRPRRRHHRPVGVPPHRPRRRRRGRPAGQQRPDRGVLPGGVRRAAGRPVRPGHATPLEPPATPPEVDLRRHVGGYERVGMRMEATLRDGDLFLEVTPTGVLADLLPAFTVGLVPVSDTLLVGKPPSATRWMPYVFSTLPDGTAFLHDGARATPKVR